MTTTTRATPNHMTGPAPRQTRRPRKRMISTVLGVLLFLGAVGLGAAGAYAAVVGYGGSYVDLGAQGSYRTDRYGLVTESTDWETTFFGWAGSVQVEVAPEDGAEIFVGAASPDEVAPYLAQVGHTVVAEHSSGGVARTDNDGAAPSSPAATAVDWTARSEGSGVQTLRWNATEGPQVIVAMNSDASRGIEVRVVSSAITLDRMPWWVPAGTLAASAILLVAGMQIFRRGRRGLPRSGSPAPGRSTAPHSAHDVRHGIAVPKWSDPNR